MSDKSKVKFESSMSLEEAISYFEAIVSSLKQGSLTLKQGDKMLTLHPVATLEIEVEAERKKNKEEISFEMKWKNPAPVSELMISSGTPDA